MKIIILAVLGGAGTLALLGGAAVGFLDARPPLSREKLEELFRQGNYKDAYDGYRTLALDPKDDPKQVGQDLSNAIQCLAQLGRVDEIDDFREAVIADPQGELAVAPVGRRVYLSDGESLRLHRRRQVPSRAASGRRPVRRAPSSAIGPAPCSFWPRGWIECGRIPIAPACGPLLPHARRRCSSSVPAGGRGGSRASRRSIRFPITRSQFGYLGRSGCGGPVDADGHAGLLPRAADLSEARNDGERWRWALAQAVEARRRQLNAARLSLRTSCSASSARRRWPRWVFPAPRKTASRRTPAPSPWTRSATRKRSPAWPPASSVSRCPTSSTRSRSTSGSPTTQDGHGEEALTQLASIFENRRQFDRAADS